WHSRSDPDAARGAAKLSDLGPSALSARTDTTRDASVFLRRREGRQAVQPRQAGGGLSARQDGAGQASVRDAIRRLCARVRVGPPFDHAAVARSRAVPRLDWRTGLPEALQCIDIQYLGHEL